MCTLPINSIINIIKFEIKNNQLLLLAKINPPYIEPRYLDNNYEINSWIKAKQGIEGGLQSRRQGRQEKEI